MTDKMRMTALNTSVGADDGRSLTKCTDDIITDEAAEIKDFEELQRKMRHMTDPAYLHTFSMNELYDREFEVRPPIVEGLLYPGTYLLAGASKVGKSFLVAQIAYHVSTGKPLWEYPVHQCGVLYLALEDDQRRLQSRLARMFGVEGTDALSFAISSQKISFGLETQLDNYLRENPKTRLIIIDTLQKVRMSSGDIYSYADDYETIGKLKQFTDARGICVLVVHHTRKQRAEDIFEMISGTNGLMGAADGAMILNKEKRTSMNAALAITGRDQPDQTIYLVRDEARLVWQFERSEARPWELQPDPFLETVSAVLTDDVPEWEGRASDLAVLLQDSIQPNLLIRKLNIGKEKLAQLYSIAYTCKRTKTGSLVRLSRIEGDDR